MLGYTHVFCMGRATPRDRWEYCPIFECVLNQSWWPLTGSRNDITYTSASIHDSNEIPTAIWPTQVFVVGQHGETNGNSVRRLGMLEIKAGCYQPELDLR